MLSALLLCFSTVIYAQNISLVPFASGFSQPIDIQSAGDDRLFIVEQAGRIKVLNADGTTNATNFLDISSQISSGGERGLLGLAFHPEYATNGFFFVNYSLPNSNGDNRIARFTVSADPDIANPATELPILTIPQPFANHNGGAIAFDPSGFLVISSGDGGSQGDPQNNSQNTENLLGKLLRIDINNTVPGGANYTIPTDNPFAGNPSNAEEIWAYGIRNAWKFSFDAETDEIWIADVGDSGADAREEINKMPGDEAGLNYGWSCYEGFELYVTTDPNNCPDLPEPSEVTFPVAVYPPSQGRSITGGYVYRGDIYTNMQGLYFFADFVSGIWGYVDEANEITIIDDTTQNWSTFGQDNNNEIYIASYAGAILKIEGENLVGIEENNANNIGIYPNPAENSITINASNSSLKSVNIYNISGSLVLETSVNNTSKTQVNTSTLPQGFYLVKISTIRGQEVIKKLIIK